MTYQIQKHEDQIVIVEQRNDDIPPVILDTVEEDKPILENTIGEILEDEDFELIELEIDNYPGNYHTVAKLIIPDKIREILS